MSVPLWPADSRGYAGEVMDGVMRQHYGRGEGDDRLEVVVDAGGLSHRRGEQARRVGWGEVEALEWRPPDQQVTLVVGDCRLALPFDLEGADGDFDDLLFTVSYHVELEPPLPQRFGRWRWGWIAIWGGIGGGGVAAITALSAGEVHWIVGAALSLLWLSMVHYAGLGRERRIVVGPEGCELQRLWSRRRLSLSDIASARVCRAEAGRGRCRLELRLQPRAGVVERFETLEDQTLEAYLALRASVRASAPDED